MKTKRFNLNILLMTLVIFTSFFAFKIDVAAAKDIRLYYVGDSHMTAYSRFQGGNNCTSDNPSVASVKLGLTNWNIVAVSPGTTSVTCKMNNSTDHYNVTVHDENVSYTHYVDVEESFSIADLAKTHLGLETSSNYRIIFGGTGHNYMKLNSDGTRHLTKGEVTLNVELYVDNYHTIGKLYIISNKEASQPPSDGRILVNLNTSGTNQYKVHGASTVGIFKCDIDDTSVVKLSRPSSWNYYLEGLKTGTTNVTCYVQHNGKKNDEKKYKVVVNGGGQSEDITTEQEVRVYGGKTQFINTTKAIKSLKNLTCSSQGTASVTQGGQYRVSVYGLKTGICYFELTFTDSSKIKYTVYVLSDADTGNIDSDDKTASISFENLYGSQLGTHGFDNCRSYTNATYCDYEIGESYNMPTATDNSKYGKFLGWAIVGTQQFCKEANYKESEGELYGTTFSPIRSTNNNYTFYAVFEKTCDRYSSGGGGGGGSSNPSVDVPNDPIVINPTIGPDGLCDTYKVYPHPVTTYSGGKRQPIVSYQGSSSKVNLYLYQAQDQCNFNNYTAICYDPIKKSPKDSTIYKKVAYVNPFDDVDAFSGLGLNYDEGEMSKSVEAFVLKMIQDNYSDINSTTEGKVAAQIALRTFIYGNFAGFANMDADSIATLRNYRELFCAWSDEAGQQACRDAGLNPTLWSPDDALLQKSKAWWQVGSNIGSKCVLTHDCDFDELTNVGFQFSDPIHTCDKENGKNKLVYTGTVTGLDSYVDTGATVTLKELICPEGLECRLTIGNTVVSQGQDIRNLGNTFKFEVIGNLCGLNNASANVGIKLEHYDAKDWHNVIVIQPTNSAYQRMLLINEGNKITTDLVFGDAAKDGKNCGCSCYQTPELTPGSPSFDRESFARKCCDDPALTESDRVAYCPSEDCVQAEWIMYCENPPKIGEDKDGNGIDDTKENGDEVTYYIKEGIEKGTNGNADSLNINKCVMNLSSGEVKTDLAGNTYKLTGNDYCSIACKEDWEFTLPTYKTYGGEHVGAEFFVDKYGDTVYNRGNTGRYFLLKINKVQGTRTCYTSDIKINKFKTDLENANTEVINAYNAWLYEEAVKKAYDAVTATSQTDYCTRGTQYDTCSCTQGSSGCTCLMYPDGESCSKTEDTRETSSDTYDKKTICSNANDADCKYTCYTSDGVATTCTISQQTFGYSTSSNTGGSNCSHADCTITGTDADEDFEGAVTNADGSVTYEHGTNAINAKKAAYEQAVKNRDAIISAYNQCSTFANNYAWNPEIRYNYDETASMSQENKETLSQNNYFDFIEVFTETDEQYCKENANDSNYSCNTYNDAGASQNLQLSIFESCPNGDGTYTLKNCTKNFYNNKNVMKKVTHYASYSMKGYWYTQNGTGDVLYSPTKKDIPGYTLTGGDSNGKVFPVNNTSTMNYTYEENYFGMASYRLEFSNIGQFQDGDVTLGRLIGGIDKNGTKSVFAALNKTSDEEGTKDKVIYSCTYGIKEKDHCVGVNVDLTIESIEVCPNNDCSRPTSYILDPNGSVGFFSRAISLNDLNPNDRTLGGNWRDTKGLATISAIESTGNSAYEKLEYSYTLTPTGIASIRNDSGNYTEFGMTCDDKGYKCESDYLKELDKKLGVTVNAKLKDADLTTQNSDDKFTLYNGKAWK